MKESFIMLAAAVAILVGLVLVLPPLPSHRNEAVGWSFIALGAVLLLGSLYVTGAMRA